MRSPARIGLIVLALAIAVVGAGAVGMAFLPAAVTEPVVKPVTQSVELLTGDNKPETITVDFDEQPAALGISNYPRIQLGAMRYTTDSGLIDRASELLKGKIFKRWYGYASYRAKANDMVGGCHSSIELDTAIGAKLCDGGRYCSRCRWNPHFFAKHFYPVPGIGIPGGQRIHGPCRLCHGGRPDRAQRFYGPVYPRCL